MNWNPFLALYNVINANNRRFDYSNMRKMREDAAKKIRQESKLMKENCPNCLATCKEGEVFYGCCNNCYK